MTVLDARTAAPGSAAPGSAGPGSPGDARPDDPAASGGDPPGRAAGLRARLATTSARLGDPSVPLVLTLVLVVLATNKAWYVSVPVVVLGVLGLVLPSIRESARFWLVLAATLGAAAWADRWRTDNHQYLIAYWCLALGLAASSADPQRARRVAARLLVGSVFLLATCWKLLSPDFLDGSFMRYTALTDPRFSEVATVVGGVAPDDLDANRDALRALDRPDEPLEAVRLRSTDRLDQVAGVLTWWTIAIEGLVAAAFLVPWRRLARHRDLALIAFVVTTYAVAPVVGFGWVLVCLGLTQREPGRRLVPLAYVATFLLVQAFIAPWVSVAGLAP